MNRIPTEVTDLEKVSRYLDMYSAQLNEIDIEQFEKDKSDFQEMAELVVNAKTDIELNNARMEVYKHFELPWKGDFEEFMLDSDSTLVFE